MTKSCQQASPPPHLVASATHSDDLMRLHGVHAISHHLVAVGARGGDDASIARHFFQLKPEGAQSWHSPHGPSQLCSSSTLTSEMKMLKIDQ